MRDFNKILIIFPEDPSTEFLAPISAYLCSISKKNILLRIKLADENITIPKDTDLIVFLGHGASNMLYGPIDNNREKKELFSLKYAAEHLSGQSLVLVACKSHEYIENLIRSTHLKAYFGFGDMPTDWEHIVYQRELESDYMAGFEESHLIFYRSVLTESIIQGFYMANPFTYPRDLYLGIKFIINKKINEILLNSNWPRKTKFQLICLLNDLKNELDYSY